MVCDFCSSPDVVCSYECKDFDSASKDVGLTPGGINLILASKGLWAACAECSALIEARNIEGIVSRAVDAFAHDTGEPVRTEVATHLRYTYELFFCNQVGDVTRFV